jgi:ATP-dependent Clp protease ATP-binding subunit ClpA
MWERLSPSAAQVMNLARDEAEQLGQDYIGDEHVLLGLLSHGVSRAAALLREAGLTAAGVRAELGRLQAAGQTPRRRADDAVALRAVGIDVEAIRSRLVAAFGSDAVSAAVWRASRRPWWRGGGRQRTPLCGPALFAKRALQAAADVATARGDAQVTPEHLLYGLLQDIDLPLSAQLSRRGRKHLSQLGWSLGTGHPARLLLQAHRVDPSALRERLSAATPGPAL